MANDDLLPSVRNQRVPRSVTGRYILETVRRGLSTGMGGAVTVGAGGRYVLDKTLGQGSMGVVYLARDTKLGRDVALKVISTRERGPDTLHQELLIEAQTLAKVRHANVVAIYDVVFDDGLGELFLTMPYVPGQSLAEWQSEQPVRAVVAKYLAAARGLAAAHEAGVVHRDFKPSNVIVAADDIGVFVIDFGLARARARAQTGLEIVLHANELSELGSTTSDTTLVGTLPYIAPELVDGEAATPASDQYAFCVALWQGVTNELPFGKQPRPPGAAPPSRDSLPGWLYRALCRGLSARAGDRFATMHELIASLERGMRRRRRLALGAASSVVVAVAVAVVVTAAQPSRPAAVDCVTLATAMDDVWNEDARARVRRALVGGGREQTQATTYAFEVFEASAMAWRDASVASCEAHVLKPESHRAMNQRECLEVQLAYFTDVVDRIEQLGPRSLPLIHKLLDPLTRPSERCELPRPIVHEKTRRALIEIGIAQSLRDYERALDLAREEIERSNDYAERCLESSEASIERGELQFEIARVHGGQDHPAETLAALDQVDVDALDCGHDELLARSNILRAQVFALDLTDPVAAQRALDAGVAGYRQIGGFGAEALEVHEARAFVALARDAPREAIEHYQAAIESLPDELASRPLEAKLLVNIGVALHELGEYAQAERAYDRAIARVSGALGPEHPETRARRARAVYNRALAAIKLEDVTRAQTLIAELEVLDEPGLAVQVQTVWLQQLVGDTEKLADAFARAEALATTLERSESIPSRTQTEADTFVGLVFAVVDDPRSLLHLQRALAAWERLPDPNDYRDQCELVYAQALTNAGRNVEARQHLLALLARFDSQTPTNIRADGVGLAEHLGLPPPLGSDDEREAPNADDDLGSH